MGLDLRHQTDKDLAAAWFVISISKLAGSPTNDVMTHYVAIVEDAGADTAIGIWFPYLPGYFSAGDDVDEALRNAHEALSLYAEAEAGGSRFAKAAYHFGLEI